MISFGIKAWVRLGDSEAAALELEGGDKNGNHKLDVTARGHALGFPVVPETEPVDVDPNDALTFVMGLIHQVAEFFFRRRRA